MIANATIEKRRTGLLTSPRAVKLIPRKAGSISSFKQKKNSVRNLRKKSRMQNGLKPPFLFPLHPKEHHEGELLVCIMNSLFSISFIHSLVIYYASCWHQLVYYLI